MALLASAGSLENIRKCVAQYCFADVDTVVLLEKTSGTYEIQVGDKLLSNFQVRLKTGRYRFEHK